MADKGAHFFRCDLQVHTPRDLNWTGVAGVTDEERLTYARALVQACRDRGLQGIGSGAEHQAALYANPFLHPFQLHVKEVLAEEVLAARTNYSYYHSALDNIFASQIADSDQYPGPRQQANCSG